MANIQRLHSIDIERRTALLGRMRVGDGVSGDYMLPWDKPLMVDENNGLPEPTNFPPMPAVKPCKLESLAEREWECALSQIRQYATDKGLTPEQVTDIFSMGIVEKARGTTIVNVNVRPGALRDTGYQAGPHIKGEVTQPTSWVKFGPTFELQSGPRYELKKI